MQKFSIFSLVGNALSGHERWKPFWRDAVSRPYVIQAMEELRQWLPPDLARYVEA